VLGGVRKAAEEDDSWSFHSRPTKGPERPQPSAQFISMRRELCAPHQEPIVSQSEHVALPPEPSVRHITPAPEDFENQPAPLLYLWPVAWMGLGTALAALLWARGWPLFGH
jgi:hypothetical protein